MFEPPYWWGDRKRKRFRPLHAPCSPTIYLDVKILEIEKIDMKRLHIDRPLTLIGMEDEVDRLVAAWRRERPDLDVEPLEVLSRVSRLARHLDRARRLAFSEHGLEPWEFDVLTSLRRAGAPYQLSPGQLLTQTLVTSGTMTNRIDRLAKKGLVERLPDPNDRRGVLVRLTPEGRDRADQSLAGLLAQERAILAQLSRGQRGDLAGLLRQLTAPFDNIPG
ncbi:MarR family transcriptional regulator [Streptomyces goshikiensis]|nr:MarR family transcriptional regulator [Streptomyces goshikiensis]